MKLRLQRVYYEEGGVFSNLFEVGHGLLCVTLEHAYPSGDLAHPHPWMPKVPPGVFSCVRGAHRLHSMKEDFETFEVTGVAGHAGILFHWGNWNEDSEGCLLTGDELSSAANPRAGGKVSDLVTNTRAAFARFMDACKGLDRFDLEVLP